MTPGLGATGVPCALIGAPSYAPAPEACHCPPETGYAIRTPFDPGDDSPVSAIEVRCHGNSVAALLILASLWAASGAQALIDVPTTERRTWRHGSGIQLGAAAAGRYRRPSAG